ncbi:uncharacterized protein LOC122506002 [Leptopilina heterotoma]|uniref:uncharacterized protein LOC122506002 n=1 Tax=Leptopilina heterotoma TaxID=63436 RepID=UPI001CA87CF2|nr:uncharacterized protein LOC122506002 [Leptopilina heterotoma]
MAFVDKNGHNLDLVCPTDREKYRNMCKELNYLKQVEIQNERINADNLKYRQTMEKQETEIKELLDIVDKLVLNLKIDKGKKEIPVEGLPEGPDAKTFLSQDDKNKIEKIRDRILSETQKTTKTKIQVIRKFNRTPGGFNLILNIFKYFLKLGLLLRRGKSSSGK